MEIHLPDLNNYLEYTPNLNILRLGMFPGTTHSGNVIIIQNVFEPLLNQHAKRFPLQHLSISLYALIRSSALDSYLTIDALFQKPEFDALETVQFDWFAHSFIPSDFEVSFHSNFPFLKKSERLAVKIIAI